MTWPSSFSLISDSSLATSALIALPTVFARADHGLSLMGEISGHPEYPNNRAVLAIENIRSNYKERLQKHDFLQEGTNDTAFRDAIASSYSFLPSGDQLS